MDQNERIPEEEMRADENQAISSDVEENEAAPSQKRQSSPFVKGLISWGKTIVAAFILAMLMKTFLVVNATVMSGSMEDTVMTGDRIICNRLSYVFGEPQRYDIIAFDFIEPSGIQRVYVKRIIGLPGETVEIADGKIYIDGAEDPLRDDFIRDPPWGDYGPYEIPEGHYFVLGDNRDNSADSRRWADPYLDEEDLLGKAMFRYYPNLTWLGGK